MTRTPFATSDELTTTRTALADGTLTLTEGYVTGEDAWGNAVMATFASATRNSVTFRLQHIPDRYLRGCYCRGLMDLAADSGGWTRYTQVGFDVISFHDSSADAIRAVAQEAADAA